MNRFEVVIDPRQYVHWDATHGGQPVELRIDGAPLLDLLRIAETPWAAAEDEPLEPGNYLGLWVAEVVAPSRRLLDQPGDLGFVIGPEHPCFGATAICGCTCGIQECWFVVVSIEVTATTVRWSNFRNFHRGSWPYDLGPFVFERAAYERALAEPLRLA